MQTRLGVDSPSAMIRVALLSLLQDRYLLQSEIYALLLGRYEEGRELFLHLLSLSFVQLKIIFAPKWPILG